MKVSVDWLRQWVDTDTDLDVIAERLTMLGLEVDTIEQVSALDDAIVVGEIVASHAHPHADQLKRCEVDVGQGQTRSIVCGAPNAAVGLRVPVAEVGANLPDASPIEAREIRGVASAGMLCSAAELGLGTDSGGLWRLDADAPLGVSLNQYLQLPDQVLEIDLTPNRGDCLSVLGVARELAVAEQAELAALPNHAVIEHGDATPRVHIEAPDLCVGYAARCIEAIDVGGATPAWIQQRLARAGIRCINLAVDIGNYVMLELGQPMHAFDADKLEGGLRVRRAVQGEWFDTLDAPSVTLARDTLVIADDAGPVAIAGMIGGLRTAVTDDTRHLVLESACFTPAAVAGQGRRYKIQTESLHRFERGVDPRLHPVALDRAAYLLWYYGSGQAGPAIAAAGDSTAGEQREIALETAHIQRLLGQYIEPATVVRIFEALGVSLTPRGEHAWLARPPSWRYDLAIEADLIEEVARVYGYARLQTASQGVALPPDLGAGADNEQSMHGVLVARGYNEAITYSFVEAALQDALTGERAAIALDNPISDQHAVMRRTLWASLLPVWDYNIRRQQSAVRLFESGLRFVPDTTAEHGVAEIPTIAGLVDGIAQDRHWDRAATAVDFFDIKGDVEALLAGRGADVVYEAATHPALHPGRAACIHINGHPSGWLGQLSPEIGKRYKNKNMPYVFELDSRYLQRPATIRYEPVSELPSVRRDLALQVADDMPAGHLVAAARAAAVAQLRSVEIFDVFRGQGLETGFKSVALGLIFQDKAGTLTDRNVEDMTQRIVAVLYEQCNARIRGH